MSQDTEQRIRDIVAKHRTDDAPPILPGSTLKDLGIDSLSAIGPLVSPDPGSTLRMKVAARVPDYDGTQHFPSTRLALLDPVSQYALLAAREAVQQSGLGFGHESLGARTAVVVGTGVGGEI